MRPNDSPGDERPGEARLRRTAEEVAGRILDDADLPAPEDETILEEPDRTVIVQHLFVHGLLTSLADEEQNRSASERERRVKAVMARIQPDGRPAVKARRFRVHRVGRFAAAAVIVGVLVVAGLLLVLDRGIQSEAAIDRALLHLRKGLDFHYRGDWYLEFDAEGKAIERRFDIEIITGIDRFYMSVEFVHPIMGPIPVFFGQKGELVWAQFGPIGPFDISDISKQMPMGRFGFGDPREFMAALDSMLERMRGFAQLELTEPDPETIRISGRAHKDAERPFKMLDKLVIDLDRETYEVKAFSIHMNPDLGPDLPVSPVMQGMNLPEGAKLKAGGLRLKLEKTYKAPAETYVPEDLQRDDGDDGDERDD